MVLGSLGLLVAGFALSACSVSITANEESGLEEETAASASAVPTPDASEQAAIDEEIYGFCVLEAKGSVELFSILGDAASDAITDGIAQSIEQQGMNEVQAASCTKAWIETMAENGITYVDPGTGAASGAASPAASPASSPAAS